MRLLLSFFNELRNAVPFMCAVLSMMLAIIFLTFTETNVNINVALIVSTIVGYIVGFIIKSFIPNPEDKAL